MDAKRYIGIDLHRDCFTACLRLENGREYLKKWKLEDMAKFTAKLRPTDQVAVEVTGNTRLFHDAVVPHVGRVVAVNPSQFKVITHSVKKTDPNDARNLALYLAKDLLPEVRMKDKTQAQIASLTQTRDTMVKLRTALKNKVNNVCSAHGVNLNKESLASEKGLRAVLEMRFDTLVNLELKIIIEQIRSLNQSIAELEQTIGKEGQSSNNQPRNEVDERQLPRLLRQSKLERTFSRLGTRWLFRRARPRSPRASSPPKQGRSPPVRTTAQGP